MVDNRAEPDRAGRQRGARPLRRQGLRRRPCRATCACPRRRRSASRSCCTTSRPRARRATWSWRASSLAPSRARGARAPTSGRERTDEHAKRKALGRGLAALIPGPRPRRPRARRRRRPARIRGGAPATACASSRSRTSTPRASSRARRSTTRASRSWRRRSARRGSSSRWSCAQRAAGGYELIAGERRWRAAQRAGLHEVPAVVRDVAPTQAFEMAMVENLQREDLNPHRGSGGLPAPDHRVRLHAGVAGRRASARTAPPITNALAAAAPAEPVRDAGHRRPRCRWVTRARCWASSRRRRWSGWRAGRGARAVGAPGRGAGAARAQAGGRDGAQAGGAAAPSASARDLAMRLTRALGTRVSVVEAGPSAVRSPSTITRWTSWTRCWNGCCPSDERAPRAARTDSGPERALRSFSA